MATGEPVNFEYFHRTSEREMIAECGYRVADYLHEEKIGSLVLVDMAARNLYIPVREAYKQKFPESRVPGTYFLNPAAFLSPELHDEEDYAKKIGTWLAEKEGLDAFDVLERTYFDPLLQSALKDSAQIAMKADRAEGGAERVAARLTPLFMKVVKRDSTFNGRVLVLDACRHTGGSVRGIVTALRDIGVLDVRDGVVNANSQFATDEPADYVVFDRSEIPDVCKPFGIQTGLEKGMGDSMFCRVGVGGLSRRAKQARSELHQMMLQGQQLREDFAVRKQGDESELAVPESIIEVLTIMFNARSFEDVSYDDRQNRLSPLKNTAKGSKLSHYLRRSKWLQ